MRKMVNVTHVSLDGVMERMEDWHYEYLADPDMTDSFWESLSGSDILLLGRRTYEGFAAAWPQKSGQVADRLNSMRKYVVSATVAESAWNNTTVLARDVSAKVAELKREDGGDIISYGFGPIARELLDHGLLDEFHLGVDPTLAGKGDLDEMLIREGAVAKFRLTATRPLSSGVVMLSYEPLS